jgi:serine phosphatase RsbU (regulator of sigma subunit)/ligand-binding sensor domain-containing protein
VKSLSLLLAGIFTLLLTQSVQSQVTLPTQPLITNFTPKEYRSHAQNLGVMQDPRGIMYFANINGILEYDGVNWQSFSPKVSSLTFSLAMDPSGRIFSGGRGEFVMMKADKVGNVQFEILSDRLPESERDFSDVWNTIPLNNKIYFNAGKYLFVYQNDSIVTIPAKTNFDRAFDVNSELWITATDGIYKVTNNTPKLISNSDFFADKRVTAIIPYNKELVLIATRTHGIYLFGADQQTTHNRVPFAFDHHPELINSVAYGGIRLHNGNFAFNTLQNGIYIFTPEGELVTNISREQGLQYQTVTGLYEDNHGQLWCSLGNGISVITLNSPLTYSREGESFQGAIQDILQKDGLLYLATMQGSYFTNVSSTDSLDPLPGKIHQIEGIPGQNFDLLDVGDEVLIASYNVFSVKGTTMESIAPFQTRTLCKIKGSASNMVAAGGQEGLIFLEKNEGSWETKLKIENFSGEIYYVVQDPRSDNDHWWFWIGTANNETILLKVKKDWSDNSQEDQTAKAHQLSDGMFYFFAYNDNVLFSNKRGLYHFDHTQSAFVKTSNFFKGNSFLIYRLKEGINGEAWISSGRKIYHVIPNDKNEFDVDSLPFMSLDIGGIHSILPNNSGNCWLGSDGALVHYSNKSDRNYNEPYNTVIRRVTLGEDSVLFSGRYFKNNRLISKQPSDRKYTFSHTNNSISFEFISAYYQHQDHIEYSWKLEGYAEEFTPWKKTNKAFYTNLHEGEYVFKVKARNIYTNESTIDTYSFTILPPWYRTWWAYAIFITSGLLIIYIIVKLYSRRLLKEKEHLETVVHERTLELGEKNTALEQINEEISLQKAIVERKNKDITDSILYAEKIQRALLTSSEYMQNLMPEHFVYYQPKSILSGDFYWAYGMKDAAGKVEKIIYATVDCTGHGVPGALMSMIGNAYLNEIVIENRVSEPDEILNQMRTQIIKAFGQKGAEAENKDGMDMTLCVWDRSSGNLHFSGANNPLYLIRNEELIEYKGDYQPIGYFMGRQEPFTKHTIELEKGDVLYTFSDGYADQFGGPRGKKFKYAQLKELLVSIHAKPMNEQGVLMEQTLENWRGELEQIDDICIIGVRV